MLDSSLTMVIAQAIARQLRKRRFENGALKIDNVKVAFSLDQNGLPEDCVTYERKEANELIEEASWCQCRTESRY